MHKTMIRCLLTAVAALAVLATGTLAGATPPLEKALEQLGKFGKTGEAGRSRPFVLLRFNKEQEKRELVLVRPGHTSTVRSEQLAGDKQQCGMNCASYITRLLRMHLEQVGTQAPVAGDGPAQPYSARLESFRGGESAAGPQRSCSTALSRPGRGTRNPVAVTLASGEVTNVLLADLGRIFRKGKGFDVVLPNGQKGHITRKQLKSEGGRFLKWITKPSTGVFFTPDRRAAHVAPR